MLQGRRLAVLLDYDGTLTPIVADYRRALLSDAMRQTLSGLAEHSIVAVVSGRDLKDVQKLVGLGSVFYSGSHGFELAGPRGWHHIHADAADYLPDLDRAEKALEKLLASVPGHALERKHFSLAVHYRQVDEARVGEVADAVDAVLAGNPRLVKGLGKKVFELKPALPWDKGSAIRLLLDELDMAGTGNLAVFIGDDITDEAAFRVLRAPDVSIIVVDDDRVTSADYALRDCDDVRQFLDWLSRSAGEHER
jgi:trehalose-phosphatase